MAFFGFNAMNAQSTNDWFIQPQLGASYSEGAAGLGHLIAPAGQLSVGKYFSEGVGARLTIGGWYGNRPVGDGFYFGSTTLDGLFNISTLFAGVNPDRKFTTSLIAGIGFNRQFSTPESSFMGRLGLQGRVKLSDAFDFNVEALVNGVSDRWNTLDDHNFDRYYALLVGVTYRFGHTYDLSCPDCKPIKREHKALKELEKLNDQVNKLREEVANKKCCPAPVPVPVESRPGLKSYVFFKISNTIVAPDQIASIQAIADYMNKYPESKATITGYADKGTGNAKINASLAEGRAKVVADYLVNKYGIAASRLSVSSKGDTEQPFEKNEMNRVTVMIAE